MKKVNNEAKLDSRQKYLTVRIKARKFLAIRVFFGGLSLAYLPDSNFSGLSASISATTKIQFAGIFLSRVFHSKLFWERGKAGQYVMLVSRKLLFLAE